MPQSTIPGTPDIVLIGAGIMSATLGTMLKELEPSLTIAMLETLDDCAQESSQAWNNAGTGHAANCELNYTPQRPDGSVDISRALEVNVEFDLSRQLWSYLVKKGAIADPRAFIHPCPHMSFVWGKENVAFLQARYQAMSAHHCYHGMDYSEDRKQIADWAPLIIEGRDDEPADRGDAHRHRHRCRLRRADASAGGASRRPDGLLGALQAARRRARARGGRPLAR